MLMIFTRLTFLCGLLLVFTAKGAAQSSSSQPCKSFEAHVGYGQVNIVAFRGITGGRASPFIFRLAFTTFDDHPADGFFGPITTGKMTFSYPRQSNPEVAYDKSASYPDRVSHGPAYGDTVEYQAREIACNLFEIHWKEPRRGDTVTHIEDFSRQQVCTNITSINRVPIPEGFDLLDRNRDLESRTLFPKGNPASRRDFGYTSLCGTMSQSPASKRVWEDELHLLPFKGEN